MQSTCSMQSNCKLGSAFFASIFAGCMLCRSQYTLDLQHPYPPAKDAAACKGNVAPNYPPKLTLCSTLDPVWINSDGCQHLQGDAVARKGDVAVPIAAEIRERAARGERGVVEGGAAQHAHRVGRHHVLPAQHLGWKPE